MINRPTFKLHEDFNFDTKKIGKKTLKEFTEHDDFIFENKKIGEVTREEFIKYVRSSHDHMRELSEIIERYGLTLDEYLEQFELSESVRVSNEEERELNESERISKDSERDSKIEAFVEDVSDRIDNKADVSELELYAKKEQEDWITPTLINGWEQHSVYNDVGYYKDDFGVVHLRGSVGQGEAQSNIFNLPPGYRPNKFTFYPVLTGSSGNAFGSVYVANTGIVYSYQTGLNLSLNNISFRAER